MVLSSRGGCAALSVASTLTLVVAVAPATAYDLKPIVMQLEPSGPRSSQTAVITNTHSVPIAVEVRAYARSQNPDGTDALTPENKDLLITPPQMVVAPKASQSFRIQWVGAADPERELAYRIVTEQLPIRFNEVKRNDRTADLTMRYRYEAALYVMPRVRKPAARLSSVAAVRGADGKDQLELRIKSEGNTRAILDRPVLELTPAGGSPLKMEGDAVKQLVGLNILPGVERVVRMDAPEPLRGRQVSGKLTTQYVTLR